MKLRYLVTSVYAEYKEDHEYCFIPLTAELLETAAERMRLVVGAKAKEYGILQHEYWDNRCEWATSTGDTEVDDKLFEAETNLILELAEPFDGGRVEVETMRVYDDRIQFACLIKHTDCEFVSRELRLTQIVQALEGKI